MTRGSRLLRSGMLTLALATVASSAGAQLFSNGTPGLSQGDALTISIFRTADDFTLSTASSINSIRFWINATDQGFAGVLSYAFYQNDAGALGSVVYSNTVSNVTAQFLGPVLNFNQNMYLVDINLPTALDLSAGTYWLELHNGPALTAPSSPLVFWATAGDGVGNARSNLGPNIPTRPTNSALAFSLFGSTSTTAPEPSTMALSFVGLVAVGVVRARRRGTIRQG